MRLLAIDPGCDSSAAVVFDIAGRTIDETRLDNNAQILASIDRWARDCDHLAIEMVACYGMAVGQDVFGTCLWIGRFIERWGRPYTLVYRREVKMHLCKSMKAKDANIRQALIDQFGPGKVTAIGTKKSPGPLYGVSKDLWAALAVGVTWAAARQEAACSPEKCIRN